MGPRRGGDRRRLAAGVARDGAAPLPTLAEQMMVMDAVGYLPDNVLVKVDRAAMGVGLETRVPFLAKAVLEFAWRLPLGYRIRDRQGKWLLRQVLFRHVPRSLVERPKMGFTLPIGSWLRGPLREWAESLLDERRLRSEGLLDPGPIRALWTEHLSGPTRCPGRAVAGADVPGVVRAPAGQGRVLGGGGDRAGGRARASRAGAGDV